jgi:hypothetical protein
MNFGWIGGCECAVMKRALMSLVVFLHAAARGVETVF